MPRPRATSTVTHGTLKFRPVEDRGTKEDGGGRVLHYWRCEQYVGREAGKAVRRSYPALWAAQDDLPEIAARYARGEPARDPGQGRASAEEFKETATAGMILQAWLTARLTEDAASLSERGKAIYKDRVGATKELSFRKHRAATVGKPQIDALVRDLRGRFAVTTTIGVLETVTTAWRWAYERGYVPRPLSIRSQVSTLRKQAARDPKAAGELAKRTPSVEEAQAIARWFFDEDPGRGRWPTIAYLVMFSIGCRIGELAAVRWGDLRLPEAEGEPASVFLPKSKTGPRKVYLGADVLRQVLALRPGAAADTDPLLLHNHRGGWKPVGHDSIESDMRRYVRKACAEIGVPAFSPHGLRRLAVRQAVRFCMSKGSSISAAAKQMGHTVEVMLRHYEAATVEEQRQASAAMDYAMIPPKEAGNVVPLRRSKAKV